MKYKISLIALLVISLMISTVTFARSSSSARATLINRTGYDIEELYICPAGSEDWERCGRDIENGEDVRIKLPRYSDIDNYDIRCEYENGREDMWYSIELYNSSTVVLLKNGKFNDGNGSRNSNPFKNNRNSKDRNGHDDDYYKPQF